MSYYPTRDSGAVIPQPQAPQPQGYSPVGYNVLAPPPMGASPGFQAPYAATLGQQMLDNQLPDQYNPSWYESSPIFQSAPLFGSGAAARQTAYMLNSQPGSQPSSGLFGDFPTRISLPFPWSSSVNEPSALDRQMQDVLGPGSAIGTALGMAPGSGYGGTVPGTAIANTPITLSNFSAWGRERLLALIDSTLSGGNYITPAGAQFGQDNTGPANKSPLDMLIDQIKTPFNAIADVFNGPLEWLRNDQAARRGAQVRDLAQSGQVQISDRGLIDAVTSAVTGGSDKFSSDAILLQAQRQGIDYVSAVASLYDLQPEIVAQIMANPGMTNEEIAALTTGQPLSRNPAVNMSLEFAMQAAIFVGVGALTGGLGDIAQGAALGARALGAAGEVSTATRALQLGATAAQTAFRVNSINTLAGWTIGGAEWGIKQAAVLGGNRQVADLMDRLMWNMPLSMNPGVNIVTAFSSHPLEALGIGHDTGLFKGSIEVGKPGTLGYAGRLDLLGRDATGARRLGTFETPPKIIDLPGASKDYPVVLVGDQLVRLNKDGSTLYHAIQSIDSVDGFQPIFDRLGWDRDRVQAAFGPGNPDGLTLDDLKESMLYTSLSAVRSSKGPLAPLSGISEAKVTDRALKFMADNIGDAARLFDDTLNGRSTALVDEFKGQWWRFADLNDTNQAAIKARLTQEYEPNLSFVDFLSWVKVSKIHREAFSAGLVGQDTAIRLRTTINRPYVEQFRDSIIKRYDEGSIIPTKELDLLKRLGGRIEERGRGSELIKSGKTFKPMSRARLVDILDSVLEDDSRIRAEEATLPRDATAAVAPGRDIANPIEEARVLHIGTQDLEIIRQAEGLDPTQLAGMGIPRNVLREVAKWANVSEDALMADPQAGWMKVFDWLHTTEQSAVDTAKARDSLDAFSNVLHEQRGIDESLMDEAIRGAQWTRDYLLNPVQKSYLKANDPLKMRLALAQNAFEQVQPKLQALADDPIRKVAIIDMPEQVVARFAWPSSLPEQMAHNLVVLINSVRGKVNEGDLATLTDPAIHPLLKVDVLDRIETLTDAQRKVLNPLLTDEARTALQTMIESVFGPGAEADAANALRLVDKFDAWQRQSVEAGAQLAAIGSRFRSIEAGGGHTPEVLDLYNRLSDYEARSNTPWRQVSVRSYERPVPTTEQRVEGVRRQEYDRRVQRDQAALEQAQRELDTLQASAQQPDFENPVRTYPVRKGGAAAANAKARAVSRETGLPTMVQPVRKPSGAISHYEVVVGTVKPRTQAIEDLMQAGRTAESQALNVAEGVDRGGTVESGGAISEQPTSSAVNLDQMRTDRIVEIDQELTRLQQQYEAKSKGGARSNMVPPSIKGDALKKITDRMDALEAERSALDEQAATAPETAPEAPIAPEVVETPVEPVATVPEPQITPEQEAALQAIDARDVLPELPTLLGEPVYGHTTDFPIPGEETTRVPATFRLMELGDLVTSRDKGYNKDLQPRDRTRVTSQAQIDKIAQQFDPKLALRTDSGSHGPQVVDPARNVVAGNGRALAMRQMTDAQYNAYIDTLAKRAGEFGLTEDQVRAMDRPVLVREIPQELATHQLADALNAETGGMSLTETAFSVAQELTPEDLARLDLGESTTLREALTAQKNGPFIQRVLGKLTEQQVRGLSDSEGRLNADGLRIVESALLAKVIPDRAIVERFVESIDDNSARIKNGIVDALGQLTEAQALIDSGIRYPETAIGPTLSESINRLIGVRARGLSPEDARLELTGSISMFDQAGTQTAGELAWLLYNVRSSGEVRDLLRAYAKGVAESSDPTQMGMFEAKPPTLVELLNKAVGEVNGDIRERNNAAAIKRQQRAQQGMFGEEGEARAIPELPGFTDETGTIPAPFENAAGVQSMARDVPVINEADGIGARIAPANVLHVKGNPLDPATYAGADKAGEVVFHGGPERYANVVNRFLENPRTAIGEYDAIAQNPDGWGFGDGWQGAFDEAAATVNAGYPEPRQLLILDSLSADGLRFDAEGNFNGTFNPNAKLEAGRYAGLWDLKPARATHEPIAAQPGDAAVFSRQPEGTPPGAGIDADTTIERNDVNAAIDGGAQTFVKRSGVNDDAARTRTGASRGNRPDTVLEVNPPDEATLLRLAQERVDKLRQQIAENEAQRDSLQAAPETPVTQAPLPPDIESLLFDYTNEPMSATSKEFYGSDRLPDTLGGIVDAIESIDAGIPALGRNMTDGELQSLRAGLVDWLDKRLALEPGMPNKTQLKAATKTAEDRLRETVIDTPEKFADGLVTAMRALEPIVKDDPHGPPSANWEGTQYDLGYLPRKDDQGRPLPPRILSSSSLLDMLGKVAPDLPDELMMGRKMAFGPRMDSARLAGFMRAIPGGDALARGIKFAERQVQGNPEQDIRYAMLNRYADELVGPAPDGADLSALQAWQNDRRQALGIIGALHDEMSKPSNASVGHRFRKYRTEYELGPDKFHEIVTEYLGGKDALPQWAQDFMARSQKPESAFFDAWARADNRIRTWFSEQPNGAARLMTSLYDSPRARAISRNRAGLVQIYHQFRFLLDARWIALEMVEAPTLTLFREGPGALMEAMGWKMEGLKPTRKSGAELSKPMFLGLDDLSRKRADFAWWTASTNPGLNLRYRENYINGLVKHRQISDFPTVLRDMAMRDPELAQTMRALGDTPHDWLDRLNNSWELYSTLSRKLDPAQAEAFYKPRLLDGTINQTEYDKLLKAAAKDGYHYVSIPAFEQEIAQAAGNPILAPVMQRMKFLTEQAWNDAAQLIYGQVDRSNIQRLLNHPLLYWPISYQIKATKWLAGLLFDRFMGVETGSLGALTLDRIHAMHQQQYQQDPDYRKFFEDNKTLLFVASMLFPVTPFDIGVGLSPFTRLAIGTATGALGLDDPLDPEGSDYRRNIFAVGPGYTYYSLIPRLGYELGKSRDPNVAGFGQQVNRLFPYQITVGPKSSSQQTQQTQPIGWDQITPPATVPTSPQRYVDTEP